MNDFDEYFEKFLLKWEGVDFENDPDDRGGMTKFGIDARTNPTVDIAHLTKEKARILYWKEFQESPGRNMSIPISWMFFDTEVNAGRKQTIKILQRALKVRDDGEIGPKTENALLTFKDLPLLIHRFTAEREKFYKNLAFLRPSLGKYLKGWLNRTADMHRLAAAMIPRKEIV